MMNCRKFALLALALCAISCASPEKLSQKSRDSLTGCFRKVGLSAECRELPMTRWQRLSAPNSVPLPTSLGHPDHPDRPRSFLSGRSATDLIFHDRSHSQIPTASIDTSWRMSHNCYYVKCKIQPEQRSVAHRRAAAETAICAQDDDSAR